jgi:hypothetical protein
MKNSLKQISFRELYKAHLIYDRENYYFPSLNRHLFCKFHKKDGRTFTFSHPDYTVGSGITPESAFQLAGSELYEFHYRRSGITPCPEDESIFYCCYTSIIHKKQGLVNSIVYKSLVLTLLERALR